jgi:hypothetical protein
LVGLTQAAAVSLLPQSGAVGRLLPTATAASRWSDGLGRRPALCALGGLLVAPGPARAASDEVRMEGLRGEGKKKTLFPDYELSDTGLQYKDFKVGAGAAPTDGDRVQVDWTGVTIGYQGRFFQTRNKAKGGAFEGDAFLDFLTFSVGDASVIPGIDEAVRSMRPGGIRRIIVPEEIGYPRSGFSKVGPKPSTFSGERTRAPFKARARTHFRHSPTAAQFYADGAPPSC